MVWLALLACTPVLDFSDEERARLQELRHSTLGEPPIDSTNEWSDSDDAAALGRTLFYDGRLSPSGTLSCASCHDPDQGWSDGLPTSNTLAPVNRHAPVLWNLAWSRWQFWDGRCDSLWCQAAAPFENTAEMGSDRAYVAHAVADNADLRAGYEGVFGALPDLSDVPANAMPRPPHDEAWEGLSEEQQRSVTGVFVNVTKAIGAYERLLVAPPSRVDRFAEGLISGERDALKALNELEQRGAQLFVGEARCSQCHTGPLLHNREFHNIGLGPRDWLDTDNGRHDGISALRAGEFNSLSPWSDNPDAEVAWFVEALVQTDEQIGQFKTPGLRNVALSAPYMHGGHFASLAEVVSHYDLPLEQPELGHREESVIPLGLYDDDKEALVAFLTALTSEEPLPSELLAP